MSEVDNVLCFGDMQCMFINFGFAVLFLAFRDNVFFSLLPVFLWVHKMARGPKTLAIALAIVAFGHSRYSVF